MANMFQIIELCNLREDVKKKAHTIIDKFADRGLRSLAVARQVSLYVFVNLKLHLSRNGTLDRTKAN